MDRIIMSSNYQLLDHRYNMLAVKSPIFQSSLLS
jgi:hypothetical protein